MDDKLCHVHDKMDKHAPIWIATLLHQTTDGIGRECQERCDIGICSCGCKVFASNIYREGRESSQWNMFAAPVVQKEWRGEYNRLIRCNEQLKQIHNKMVADTSELMRAHGYAASLDGDTMVVKPLTMSDGYKSH